MKPASRGPRGHGPKVAAPSGLALDWVTVGDEDLVLLSFEAERRVGAQGADVEVLTAAERDVLTLVLKGCSDQDIASSRGRSPRTIQAQLAAIYKKLNVSGRRELRAALGATTISETRIRAAG